MRVLAGALILVAGLLLALRGLFLLADRFRPAIARWAGAELGLELSAAELVPSWRGWTPVLAIRDLRISRPGAAGQGAVRLADVRVVPGLGASLRAGALRLRETVVSGLALGLVRRADGSVQIRGLAAGADKGLARALLLAQRRLRFEDATLAWFDERRSREPLSLTRVSLDLQASGSTLAMAGSARLGDGSPVRLIARIEGDPSSSRWSGRIYLHAPRLGRRALVSLGLPAERIAAGARLALEAWSEWRDGRLVAVRGRYAAGVPPPGERPAGLRGRLAWRRSAAGWDALASLSSAPGEARPPALVRLSYRRRGERPARLSGELRGAPIASLRARLRALGLEPALPAALRGSDLEGWIETLRLSLEPGPGWRDSLRASIDFDSLGLALPVLGGRLRGAAGRLELDGRQASLALREGRLRSRLGGLLAEPLAMRVRAARAALDAADPGGGIEVRAARLAAPGLELDVALRLRRASPGGPPDLLLRAALRDADLSALVPLLPERGSHPRLTAWLRRALRAGRIERADLLVRSDRLDRIRLADRSASLRLRARLSGARIAYAPGWPPLEDADGALRLENRRVTADVERGRISGAPVTRMRVEIADTLGRPARLVARIGVAGTSEQGRAFLRASPFAERFRYVTEKLRPEGRMRVDLRIELPLAPDGRARASGRVELEDNRVELPGFEEGMQGVSGAVVFGPDGMRSEGGRARYLGRPIEVELRRAGEPGAALELRLAGRADSVYLARHLRNAGLAAELDVATSPLLSHLRGETPWSAELEVPDAVGGPGEPLQLRVETELTGVGLDLPDPFGKRPEERIRLRVHTTLVGRDERVLRVRYGEAASAAVHLLRKADGGWRVERGRVHLGPGEAELPALPGVVIDGSLPVLKVREWHRLLRGSAAAGTRAVAGVRRVELAIADLELLGNRFRRIALRAERDGEGTWHARMDGPDLAGTVSIPADLERQPLRLDLDRLAIAPPVPEGSAEGGPRLDPRDLPAFEFVTRSLTWAGRALGSARMRTTRTASGLRIEHAFMSNPAFEATATGTWEVEGEGESERHRTRLRVQIHTDELASLLTALGYEDSGIEGAATEVIGDVGWPGRPADFALERATGVVHFRASKGRLLQVRRGAPGRLFGLLSLTSLPRRLLLDFSDLFEKGIAFNRMEGSFALEGGNAYTSNLFLDGPVGRIDIAGRTGLVARDYDEVITVTPRLSASIPLAPIWLAEKLFRRRLLDRVFAYQYTVTGSWDDPQVERVVIRTERPAQADRP